MTALFDFLAVPLGWLMSFIYSGIPNYFAAIFLFTLIVRIILFPLSLKTQKNQADRARLAPRLDRLKKKYEKDPKKFQEKQMALYEKEGVSLTGGCMPMLVQMLVLFGIISVIYSPLKHIARIDQSVIDTSVEVVKSQTVEAKKYKETDFKGYYKEMRMLSELENYEDKIKTAIAAIDGYDVQKADAVFTQMKDFRADFTMFGKNMLQNPGTGGFSVLWLIPLLSGLTALLSSLLSMHYTKQMTGSESQPGQGCSNSMMLIMMPAFSLFITFSVPGGVGVYWICSNLIALLQTFVLNQIYNPVKIRAQAEIEYEERRRQKQEDKKRLAEARAREQRELALQQKEEKKPTSKKKKATENKTEKAVETVENAAEETAEEPKKPQQED